MHSSNNNGNSSARQAADGCLQRPHCSAARHNPSHAGSHSRRRARARASGGVPDERVDNPPVDRVPAAGLRAEAEDGDGGVGEH